ncbi:MAG: hypothetical protein V3V00_09945 [Saprospiraceae bacterium]
MNWKGNIKELQEKFWNGETSLEEEKILRSYHAENASEDILAHYLKYTKDQSAIIYTPKNKANVVRMTRRKIISIAASVAILVSAFFLFDNNSKPSNIYVASSPEEALLITQNAFAFINSKVNHTNNLVISNLSEYNKVNFFN